VRRPADQERIYLDVVLATYSSLPGTPARPSRQDRRLPLDLCRRGVSFRAVRTALLLAAARRTLRSGPPLLALPPEPGYVEYLAAKLKPFASQTSALLGER
jgi:hypothetical protein